MQGQHSKTNTKNSSYLQTDHAHILSGNVIHLKPANEEKMANTHHANRFAHSTAFSIHASKQIRLQVIERSPVSKANSRNLQVY